MGGVHRKEEKLVCFYPPHLITCTLRGRDGGDWRSDRPSAQEKSFEPAPQSVAYLTIRLGGHLGSVVLRGGCSWSAARTAY